MRLKRAIVVAADLPRCARAYAAAPSPRAWVCGVLVLVALSACGSVQTTSSGDPSSIPQSVSDSQQPVITGIPPTSAQVGVVYDYTPTVSDTVSTALTFSITNMPAWATFNTATGELKGTPSAEDVGTTNEIEISVSDSVGEATVGPFRITVTAAQTPPPATAPTIAGTPSASVVAGQAYSFTPSASDLSGNALTFLIVNRPSWASFSTNTGQLTGTPTAANVGSYANILISVSDGTLTASLPAFTITVTQPSSGGPPTISGNPAISVTVGTAYNFTPTATDPQGNALSFSIENLPAWTNFNTATGQLSGTPAASNVGSYPNILISVSDGTLTAALPAFTITVSTTSGAGPPTITGNPATSVNAGSAYSFTPSASDPEGNALTFSIQNSPAWANFSTGTGQLSGNPTLANVGTYPNILISVSDGTLTAALPAFTITVTQPSNGGPPTISGNPPTSVSAGSAYSFTPSATDPGANALTFSIQNLPSWANFNTGTGQLSGTPASKNIGSYPNILISVSDGTLTAALPAFTITVTQPTNDGPPTISGSPPTAVNAGTAYSFTPTATDPGGDALTFSIQNQPSWANFNTGTGQLSGTPIAANIGTYADISITVNAATGDGPPTITGNPATSVNVSSTYSFTPTASDPEGHALTFSIQNEPTWMTFSTSTGQLTGTPTAANVGTYADIIISVSNGTLAASLPAFSISVNQPTTGAATVTWSIPTQNTNGTPLVNLAGYKIYYGTSANSLSQSVQVANPGATSYAFTNLAAGTWYFGIVDYTTNGVESGFSNIASTTIP